MSLRGAGAVWCVALLVAATLSLTLTERVEPCISSAQTTDTTEGT